jgi:hypothetical protein
MRCECWLNDTYDGKRFAERKDESTDAHHSDVGCQERDGSEKVKEGGVRPEALRRGTREYQCNEQARWKEKKIIKFS